jgi:hypothetical protein
VMGRVGAEAGSIKNRSLFASFSLEKEGFA